MTRFSKVLHSGKTRTTGGRENGTSRSSDGRLDIRFSIPGSARIGTNPEQLFAAAWSACFESEIAAAARRRKIVLPAGMAVEAELELALGNDGHFLSARLNITIPGIDRMTAQALIDEAHANCPYSKATRSNIDVALNLV